MSIVLDGTSGIIVSGNTNTFSGVGVGLGAGAVSSNTALGLTALAANTSGANNVAVGVVALQANTTGSQNIAMGRYALVTNTTGTFNVGIGHAALSVNSTASNNTAVGSYALEANSTGTGNSAFGDSALVVNTTGNYNTAIGRQSLQSNTTGAQNVAVGQSALLSNTTASYSTAVGYQAGYVSTGQRNAFFGYQAGLANTTGESNTYIGRSAGEVMTTGVNNTIIGRFSGNQGGLDIRTSSNHIVLSDGDGNPRGYFDSNGDFRVNRQIGSYTTSGFGLFKASASVTVADQSTITLSGGSSAQLICVACGNTGTGGTFFANYNVVVSQIGGSTSGVSTTDAGGVDIAVYKNANSNTVTFKNRSGNTRVYDIAMFCGQNGGSV